MNMTALWVNGSIFLNNQKEKMKEKAREVFLDETGAVDIVAVVVLIGVAVVLAFLFRDKIAKLMNDLFDNISKNANDHINDDANPR